MFYGYEEKTVKIPVRIVGGEVKYYYGDNLPRIDDGAIGDLILPMGYVPDKNYLSVSNHEEKIEIIPRGNVIMVEVKREYRDVRTVNINTGTQANIACVRVILMGPLCLLFRGTKKSKLLPVECEIPRLHKEAKSLNSAYTIISREFEPNRLSHTGNVFKKCYYYESEHDRWFQLEMLRESVEANFEEKLLLDEIVFIKIKDPTEKLNDDENLLLAFLRYSKQIKGSGVKWIFGNNKFRYINVLHSLLDKGIIEEAGE